MHSACYKFPAAIFDLPISRPFVCKLPITNGTASVCDLQRVKMIFFSCVRHYYFGRYNIHTLCICVLYPGLHCSHRYLQNTSHVEIFRVSFSNFVVDFTSCSVFFPSLPQLL